YTTLFRSLAQLLSGLFHTGIQVHHDQFGAVLGISGGDAFAQTHGSAGDQCNFTVQFSHFKSLLFCCISHAAAKAARLRWDQYSLVPATVSMVTLCFFQFTRTIHSHSKAPMPM